MGRALSARPAAAAPGAVRLDSRTDTAQTFELATVGSSTLREPEVTPKKGDVSLPAAYS